MRFLSRRVHSCAPLACALAAAIVAGALLPLRAAATSAHAASGADTGRAYFLPSAPRQAKEFAFIHDGDLFHLFFMNRWPDSLGDEPNLRSFGHAVSSDLRHWSELDTVIAVRPGEFDADHVWSPSMIRRDGTWYMFYTGVRTVPYAWPWYQQIGVATSTDLANWTRPSAPVFTPNDVPWTLADSSRFDGSQFRDAFVMADPADTTHWLMYYVTIPRAANDQLIVGLARSDGGLAPWSDAGPLWNTDAAHYMGWSESPVVLQHGGLWYMFMTTTSQHCIRYQYASDPTADSTGWSGVYSVFDNAGRDTVSDAWFGPEVLSVNGHDYLAFVDSNDGSVGIKEIVWGAAETDFQLVDPAPLASVPPSPPGGAGLRALNQPAVGRLVTLRVTLAAAARGRLEILDVTGRRVALVREGEWNAGDTFVQWDARESAGHELARGIYFAHLSTPAGSRTLRLAITR
jgi:hypothetical protein